MEDSELKYKVQKNVQKRIAVSNIKEELYIKKTKNKKILYTVLSSCAILIICAIVVANDKIKIKQQNTNVENNVYREIAELEKESIENKKADVENTEISDETKKIVVKDKEIVAIEQVNENKKDYPDYYAGKYIEDNGKNVILLCEDTKTNRKLICSILGITESKTKFKTAKYSYKYLTQLQKSISQKMQNKELTFVMTSSLMEDINKIKVTVNTNNENDLNKIKELDTIGGAIEIEYNQNSIGKKEIHIEK